MPEALIFPQRSSLPPLTARTTRSPRSTQTQGWERLPSPRSPAPPYPTRGKTMREALQGTRPSRQQRPRYEQLLQAREDSIHRESLHQMLLEHKQRQRESLHRLESLRGFEALHRQREQEEQPDIARSDTFVLQGERMSAEQMVAIDSLTEGDLHRAISHTRSLEVRLQEQVHRQRQAHAAREGSLEARRHELEAAARDLEEKLSENKRLLTLQVEEMDRLREQVRSLELELEETRQSMEEARRELAALRDDQATALAAYRAEAAELGRQSEELRTEQAKRGAASVDPSLWGVSMGQVVHLHDEVIDELEAYCGRHEYVRIRSSDGDKHFHVCMNDGCVIDHDPAHSASGFVNVLGRTDVRLRGKRTTELRANMHLVVDRVIKPRTREMNCSYASLLNPRGLKANIFVTHSWNELFREFVSTLRTALDLADVAWICSLALPQNGNLSLVLGDRVCESPFALALRQASKLVVALETQLDVPNRAWCTYELALARHWGIRIDLWFYRLADADISALMSRVSELKLQKAEATRDEDGQMIRDAIQREHGGFDDLNKAVRELLMDRLRWYKGVYDEHKSHIQHLEAQLRLAKALHSDGEVQDILRRLEEERRKIGSDCSATHAPAPPVAIPSKDWCALDGLLAGSPAGCSLEFRAGRCALRVGDTQHVDVACGPGDTFMLRMPPAGEDWQIRSANAAASSAAAAALARAMGDAACARDEVRQLQLELEKARTSLYIQTVRARALQEQFDDKASEVDSKERALQWERLRTSYVSGIRRRSSTESTADQESIPLD